MILHFGLFFFATVVPPALWHKSAKTDKHPDLSGTQGFYASGILGIVPFPWKAVAIGGAVLVGAAVLVKRHDEAAPKAPKRIALIGDSYAVGLGPELAKIFPEFKFEGYVGSHTWEWANHNDACGQCGDWITAFKPDVVLVSLGVNDGNSSNSGHYQTVMKGIQKIGARVVWIEPPAAVNVPAARKAIAALGVKTVPATNTPLAADGLHPKSYAPWAQEIAGVVRNA